VHRKSTVVNERTVTIARLDPKYTMPYKSNQEGSHTVASLTQEQIVEELGKIIEEVTGIEPSEVTIEKSFVDDLDIDSLSMVEIAVQTEDKYGVKIPDEDLASLKTVGDAVAYIQKLEAENSEAAAELKAKFDNAE
jgi:acyl carrier protein